MSLGHLGNVSQVALEIVQLLADSFSDLLCTWLLLLCHSEISSESSEQSSASASGSMPVPAKFSATKASGLLCWMETTVT